MQRRGGLQAMSARELTERVMAEAGSGEDRAGRPPEGGEHAGEAEAPAAAPPAPADTWFALVDRGRPEDRRMERVLAQAVQDHRERVHAVRVAADEMVADLERWQDKRRAYDTYDFGRWPAVAVFRRGRLVTTFHPRLVFHDDRLQEREEQEQFEIFLAKMVLYDPSQVKEQKNF